MKIHVDKHFQSPCTPCHEVHYAIKITELDTEHKDEEINTIIQILEQRIQDQLAGSSNSKIGS